MLRTHRTHSPRTQANTVCICQMSCCKRKSGWCVYTFYFYPH